MNISVITTKPSADYELIDSGDGEKLERLGSIIVSRPDPQALWRKSLPKEWERKNAEFMRSATGGRWKISGSIPEKWKITLGGLNFWVGLTSFKHTGIFPEQEINWKWMQELINNAGRKISVLNLFGYTGGATLAVAQAGAEVVHVDGSKVAVKWARENAKLSGLENKPIRWILDDARTFVKREIKRGKLYDAIAIDPPAFGHGPKKELWKIEKDFLPLIEMCGGLLTKEPLFFVVNGYSSGYSPIAYYNNIVSLMKNRGGVIEAGELTVQESHGERLLPAGIFARWSASG